MRFSPPPPPHSAEMSLEGLLLSTHTHGRARTHTCSNILLRMCVHEHHGAAEAEHGCGPPSTSSARRAERALHCLLLKAPSRPQRLVSLQCQRRGQRSADRARPTPSFKCQLDDFVLRSAVTQPPRTGFKRTFVDAETFDFVRIFQCLLVICLKSQEFLFYNSPFSTEIKQL